MDDFNLEGDIHVVGNDVISKDVAGKLRSCHFFKYPRDHSWYS